jgi:hypothetical protein
MYGEWGNQSHSLLAVGTLDNVLGTGRRLAVEASPLVEVTHRRGADDQFEWVALFNHSGHLGRSIHAPLPTAHLKIRLRTKGHIKSIRSLTDQAALSRRELSPDLIEIVLPQLDVFEIVLVEYAR